MTTWDRPVKPKWMDQRTYDRMPSSIEMREILVRVPQDGFRVESFVAATTLTDDKEYKRNEIADLYRCRWSVELDIRSIKATMGMDILRCKTPEMVGKEAWICLLAYNLIRRNMLQSAMLTGVSPRTLSFTGAMQSVAASWLLAALSDKALAGRLIDSALASMAAHIVGNRPGRVEPRAIKRRPKERALLTKPRDQARAELLRNKSP